MYKNKELKLIKRIYTLLFLYDKKERDLFVYNPFYRKKLLLPIIPITYRMIDYKHRYGTHVIISNMNIHLCVCVYPVREMLIRFPYFMYVICAMHMCAI